ncbi:efflux transporter outer membrane subunit [Azospirillum sp. SYSU D00513]|uniref:efflux transporter outer membrane subunit n=1 Tax=Azospirillum sp. SYSU D00513 TaxID=2812561 RepID=UPI001A97C262|nr:efflux transporter outer membrane subunit [Azospirillum sp. SYSU D00513]
MHRLVALALAAGLGACSQTPDYVRPVQDMPLRYANADAPAEGTPAEGARPADVPAAATLPAPPSKWWTGLGSPELDALVEEALTNNRDLRAALHRVAQSRAMAAVEGAAQGPRLDLSGGVTAQEAREESGSRSSSNNRSSYRNAEAGLVASYEFDLWGKNRALADAALANLQASLYDREALALTLTFEVTRAYLQVLRSADRVRVAEGNLANMRQVLDTVLKRDEVGEGTKLDVAQQRASLHQLEATIPVLAQERDQAVNLLATLVGRAPGRLTVTGSTLEGLRAPSLSPGLPSDLLLRRPDIRRAEATLIGANAGIGAARGRLLPSFTLTGELGVSSAEIGLLSLSSGGLFALIAANIGAQLFDNGRAAGEVAFSEARFQELAETYGETVLTALRDVEDALVAVRRSRERLEAQRRAVTHAREAFSLMTMALQLGTVNALQVLEVERTLNASEDDAVIARYGQLEAYVSLARALGGGMETAESAAPPQERAANTETQLQTQTQTQAETAAIPSAPPPPAVPEIASASRQPAPSAETGGVRVEIDAFGSEERARELWSRLQESYPPLLAGREPLFVARVQPGDGRTLTHLRVALPDRAEAVRFCETLHADNRKCTVLRPPRTVPDAAGRPADAVAQPPAGQDGQEG